MAKKNFASSLCLTLCTGGEDPVGMYSALQRARCVDRQFIKSAHGGNTISSGMTAGSLDLTGEAGCSDSPGAESTTTASSDDDDGGDADPEPARRRPHQHPSHALAATSRGTARNATPTAGESPRKHPQDNEIALWRLPTVLAHVPVSRSGWWAGVKSGRYPQPVRISTRCVAWRAADIRSLVESL